MHDDRVVLNPLELPLETQRGLVMAMNKEDPNLTDLQIAELMYENIEVHMGYSCERCYSIKSFITGWEYNSSKNPKGGR